MIKIDQKVVTPWPHLEHLCVTGRIKTPRCRHSLNGANKVCCHTRKRCARAPASTHSGQKREQIAIAHRDHEIIGRNARLSEGVNKLRGLTEAAHLSRFAQRDTGHLKALRAELPARQLDEFLICGGCHEGGTTGSPDCGPEEGARLTEDDPMAEAGIAGSPRGRNPLPHCLESLVHSSPSSHKSAPAIEQTWSNVLFLMSRVRSASR